jgi:hypothetical protein
MQTNLSAPCWYLHDILLDDPCNCMHSYTQRTTSWLTPPSLRPSTPCCQGGRSLGCSHLRSWPRWVGGAVRCCSVHTYAGNRVHVKCCTTIQAYEALCSLSCAKVSVLSSNDQAFSVPSWYMCVWTAQCTDAVLDITYILVSCITGSPLQELGPLELARDNDSQYTGPPNTYAYYTYRCGCACWCKARCPGIVNAEFCDCTS